MLSLFPYFLSFPLLAPFVFRLICGYFFLTLSYAHFRKNSESGAYFTERFGGGGALVRLFLGGLEGIVAVSLFAGAFTQLAGLMGALLVLILLFLRRTDARAAPYQSAFLFLLSLLSLSFLVLGAGAYAVDLPL